MYCDKVIDLLKELERSRGDTIPPYNVPTYFLSLLVTTNNILYF